MTFTLYTQPHCPRCPELKKFAEETLIAKMAMEGNTVIATDHIEECAEKAVMSTPTIIFYEDGVEKGRAFDSSGAKKILDLS